MFAGAFGFGFVLTAEAVTANALRRISGYPPGGPLVDGRCCTGWPTFRRPPPGRVGFCLRTVWMAWRASDAPREAARATPIAALQSQHSQMAAACLAQAVRLSSMHGGQACVDSGVGFAARGSKSGRGTARGSRPRWPDHRRRESPLSPSNGRWSAWRPDNGHTLRRWRYDPPSSRPHDVSTK